MHPSALDLMAKGPMVVLDRHKMAAIDIARKQSTQFLINWKMQLIHKIDPDSHNYGFVKMYLEVVEAELSNRNIPHNK